MAAFRDKIGKIVFPEKCSQVFACMGQNYICIYSVSDFKELLRIQIQDKSSDVTPYLNCLEFSADGRSIITGWSDGCVRAFTPQSGKLLFLVREVHRVPRQLPTKYEKAAT